jgi:hypothetical protein
MADIISMNDPGHHRPGLVEKFKLAILIPSLETWHGAFGLNFADLCKSLSELPIGREKSDWFAINRQGSDLAYNREHMVLSALEDPDVTHILWLDSDMKFPPDTCHWMVNRHEDIVIANYPRRQVPSWPVTKSLDNEWLPTRDSDHGLQEVRGGGLGVALFCREVFESIRRPWFRFEWVIENGDLKRISEDVNLFDKCRKAGYKVMLDHDLSKFVEHIGSFEYNYHMMYTENEGVIGASSSK